MTIATEKRAARTAATARREAIRAPDRLEAMNAHLDRLLAAEAGRPVSGYMAMRGEPDPAPAMVNACARGPVCVPVVVGKGLPLAFRAWTPGVQMVEGAFGALIPVAEEEVTPEVLIVPLLAFDAAGYRLGYGGGFYDRTLERLRAAGPVLAVGFAWAGQEVEDLPREATDQPLDAVVTEAGLRRFGG